MALPAIQKTIHTQTLFALADLQQRAVIIVNHSEYPGRDCILFSNEASVCKQFVPAESEIPAEPLELHPLKGMAIIKRAIKDGLVVLYAAYDQGQIFVGEIAQVSAIQMGSA